MKLVKILIKSTLCLLAASAADYIFAAKNVPAQAVAPLSADPLGQNLYDSHRWSLMYYYGQTVNGAFLGTLVGNYKHWPEHIQSLELAYTLNQDNFLRKLVYPLVGVVQLAANTTIRQGDNEPVIFEFDPYIIFRWANWPWNHYVTTSFGFAEGVSYVSSVPAIEKRGDPTNTRRFLNYLMYEFTFARPSFPELQFIFRVHHRSGAYGLYHAGNSGSNDVGLGIRYLF
ncbi:MAG TPA: hypothetical protein VL360_06920 [Gammaproteobacteria bacterium]|nr:hypothetical protein [Gammaproteobacteria bacterium]